MGWAVPSLEAVRPMGGRIAGAAVVVACLSFAGIATADPARDAFVSRHRCRVVAQLTEIHRRGPVETSHNRFIVLSLRDFPERYTQCIFFERDTAMSCEASSGAYLADAQDAARYVPRPDVIETLHRLGFRQKNRSENFSREVELGAGTDVTVAADLMLAVLFEAYGVRAGTPLVIEAPQGGGSDGTCGAPARKRARRPGHSAAST